MHGTDCPANAEWLEWLRDPLEGERAQRLAAHLESCAACQRLLESLSDADRSSSGDSTSEVSLTDLRQPPPGDPFEIEMECARAADLACAAFNTSSVSDPTSRAARPGEGESLPKIDGYEILCVLGRGGMGVVYKARHTSLNRTAAIKMILGGKYTDPVMQARFLIEAEVIARLRHPHVVQIFEYGRCEDQPYFVLDYVTGGSLGDKLKADGRFVPRAAAEMVAKLAGAMAAAHAQGIIHRDLKPANILLTESGEPKVADFGLAKVGDSATTVSGSIMGTPSYMAPEQAAGRTKDVGTATDVYALGAILYVLLTGRPPFAGDTVIDTIQQVLVKAPDRPQRLVPGLPRDLTTICLKCLEKAPEKRYASAALLEDDLNRYLEGKPIVARPVGRIERAVKWVKRNSVVTAAVTTVVLAMTTGTTVSYLKYRDAEWQRHIAEKKEQDARYEEVKAKKARDFLVSILQVSDYGGRGAMTARQILDDAEKRIPTEFADQPDLRAELLAAIESVYEQMTANAPLAMILTARGTVRLHPVQNPDRQPVPQTLLYAGDRLTLGTDGDIRLVFLSSLHKERLRPNRDVTIRRKGCDPPDAVGAREQDVLMTFVRLPKGTFFMGWDGTTKGVKTVIPEDFEIAVHLVTQGQWQKVMGYNPSDFNRYGGHSKDVKDLTDEELNLFPVEGVNWDDAQEFLKALNERQSGRGWTYRLPTSAEWEYACRAGATSEVDCSHHFYFAGPTNSISSAEANFNGEHPFGGGTKGSCLGRPTRVGSYPPNAIGLHDMHCNVEQWCSDGVGPRRFVRGGGWGSDGYYCRSAHWMMDETWKRNEARGFRLVRVPAR